MRILGLETSCDETSAAVVETSSRHKVSLLSNVVASSLPLHARTGGIIPENAAREQVKFIIPVIEQAIFLANCEERRAKRPNIDAIAVTYGPGLIGSLLVGVETAKTLSFAWDKPIVPVNHLIGHIYANFIGTNPKSEILNPKLDARRYSLTADIDFPAIALIVSGGHTDLILIRKHQSIKWLGGTRDDAAGEAFDKIGRLLNLPYPGGPEIEKQATKGNPKVFDFPRPMIGSGDFDFSFSGLKAAVTREVSSSKYKALSMKFKSDLAASVQQAIIDVLISKTLKAAKKYGASSILLGGGVAANQKLRDEFELNAKRYTLDAKIFAPEKSLCTDNAAMIATAALFNYKPIEWKKVSANPELYFD
ncbi:MAG: tRNA (adenosine(37)-N6)-threonylcarbamoyltransferase complex transferase subunit TsaD [Candidatus Levybacteria bacterium]|nr:tRNA (adenosine(37)-N6)-threonylcarbamoyltransferase complex transferase subunit TsaD [Candidatus Levybacteria bacterium]